MYRRHYERLSRATEEKALSLKSNDDKKTQEQIKKKNQRGTEGIDELMIITETQDNKM